jgi:hypothetical protein
MSEETQQETEAIQESKTILEILSGNHRDVGGGDSLAGR